MTASHGLASAAEMLGAALGAFLATLGLPMRADATWAELGSLQRLAAAVQAGAGHDLSIMFDPDFQALRASLPALTEAIARQGAARDGLAATYDESALVRVDVNELDQEWRQAVAAFWPSGQLGKRKVQKLMQGYIVAGTADPEADLPLLLEMQDARQTVDAHILAGKPVGFAGLETDLAAVELRLNLTQAIRQSLAVPGYGADQIKPILAALAPALRGGAADDPVRLSARRFMAAFAQVETALQDFTARAGNTMSLEGDTILGAIKVTMADLTGSAHLLRDWSSWCRARRKAIDHNLGPLVDDIETGLVAPAEAGAAFALAYARWWLPPTLDSDPVLRGFRRFQHEHAITDFREIDDLVRAQASRRVTSAIAHGLPPVQSVPRNSELGLLRHQMELQRPSRSIREMIGAMPQSFGKLAPCVLMSPLSIAQYLPPDQALFDVVIFDEASQITTWDAVGAIARARQTIIVGDPKQLPPTNFFGSNEDDDDVIEHERDLESILDEAKASGIPVRDLRWHYRSRNESLIAFSNHHYYQNRLITFPSPSVEDRAVQLRKIRGIYDRGKSRTNRTEAQAVADEAVSRMRAWLKLPEKDRPTLGIITFNAQQQSLIQDLLDAARRSDPTLEWFFADDRIEPAIVKNLENVQGDERDVILFSITFSEDAAGVRRMDFGALNRDGGERRLNVAVTRARQELLVFSGFTADQIYTSRTKAVGAAHLKTFLDFAERGAIALPAQDRGSVGGFDSPFEEAVVAQLQALGWQIVSQVGISGFRVDIGIRHPDLPGAYLAGVECDGATYHSSATARDRDKVREQVLRGLGWNIFRVWSTDWWFDLPGCVQRLHESLTSLLEDSRRHRAEQEAAESVAAETTSWDMGREVETIEPEPEPEPVPEQTSPPQPQDLVVELVAVPDAQPQPAAAEAMPILAHAASAPHETTTVERYRITDLSGIVADPNQFYDFAYRNTLKAMVDAVVAQEAPVLEDVLAQRIARAHGWLRTGSRIRERVGLHLRDLDRTVESSGTFIWPKDGVAELLDYRPPFDADSRRSIADIPLAELAAVVMANRAVLDQFDPALDLARLLGVGRGCIWRRSKIWVEACFVSSTVRTCIWANASAICPRTCAAGCARRVTAPSAGSQIRRSPMAPPQFC